MQVISVVENLKYNTLYVAYINERCVRTHAVSMCRIEIHTVKMSEQKEGENAGDILETGGAASRR